MASGRASESTELPGRAWLTGACGVCPVLLLCQHSIPHIPCLVDDIIVSDLLVGCFDPPLVCDQAPPSSPASPSPGPAWRAGLSCQMAALVVVQYLAQLVADDRLSREDIETQLHDARLEVAASTQQQQPGAGYGSLLSAPQLVLLANLTAAASKGRVKVVSSPVSLDAAIVRALKFVLEIHKHNQSKFPRVPLPDFVFVLATPAHKPLEFCVLVTSVSQAKYLAEAMLGHPVGARIAENLAKLDQVTIH